MFSFEIQLAAVIVGEYEKDIEACVIVDCRYPYEYEAGHIRVRQSAFLFALNYLQLRCSLWSDDLLL